MEFCRKRDESRVLPTSDSPIASDQLQGQQSRTAERSALLTQYAESLAQTNALKESLDGIWGEHCHRDLLPAVGNFRDRFSDSGIDIHQKITDATASYRERATRCRRMEQAQLPGRSRECTFLGLSGIFATASRVFEVYDSWPRLLLAGRREEQIVPALWSA